MENNNDFKKLLEEGKKNFDFVDYGNGLYKMTSTDMDGITWVSMFGNQGLKQIQDKMREIVKKSADENI